MCPRVAWVNYLCPSPMAALAGPELVNIAHILLVGFLLTKFANWVIKCDKNVDVCVSELPMLLLSDVMAAADTLHFL